jgi:cell shape-determining protein MreD
VKLVVAAALTFVAQRCLGWPGVPAPLADVVLPMVWLVAPPMLHREYREMVVGLAIGIGWDIIMGDIIGPGAIAFSGAAVAARAFADLVADRSPRAWFLAGIVGTAVTCALRQLALLPLGLASLPELTRAVTSLVLTGLWCAAVAWIIAMDLPTRWRRWRARTLR